MSFAESAPQPIPRPGRSDGSSGGEPRSWATPPSRSETYESHPTVTVRLPGGKRMRLSTDRVRARPAISPTLSMMLGQNAIGLGVWGLFFPRGVSRFLGMDASPGAVRALFGAREMVTGVALAGDPTNSGMLWARVAGDAFDIATPGALNRPENPRRGNARLALGVVLAVTALDIIAAVRMSTVKRNLA